MHGFGAVVTGTLTSGRIAVEDELELYPTGRRVRVRGVQVHGQPARAAVAGQRTAVNLSGIDSCEAARGMVLAAPSVFRPTRDLDCRITLLPSARRLKHRAPVHFHAGTAEIEAEVRLLEEIDALAPGGSTFARVVLRDPVLLLPGDRFIIRMFSPVVTIGGGIVVDPAPPHKWKRADLHARAARLAAAPLDQQIRQFVAESHHGLSLGELAARTGRLMNDLAAAAKPTPLVWIPQQPHPWLLDPAWRQAQLDRWTKVLAEFHRANPLAPGMPREELRSRELAGAPAFVFDALLQSEKRIAVDGDTVRLSTHHVAFRQDEQQAVERMEAAFQSAGLAVPSVREVMEAAGVDPTRARSLLQTLLRERRLVRVGEDLIFHRSALEYLRGLLTHHKGRRLTVAAFKDLTGVSRKYAIPLLEFLDRERVTRREGDSRLVL